MPRTGPRDVVLRCRSGAHRVRLGRGRRFWARARCPVCRTELDATRLRRVGAWAATLRRPAGTDPIRRGLWWASLAYVVGIAGAAILLWGFSDRWWPATLLLFGPRWLLALPLLALVPAAGAFDRALLVPLGVSALILAVPILGVRTGWRAPLAGAASGTDLRVVTFNAQGGEVLLRGPLTLLDAWRADIAGFQECGPALRSDLTRVVDWHWDARGSLCLASRFPIVDVQEMEREAFRRAGGSALVATWTLDVGGRRMHVTNLHLETPRAGFELIRAGRVAEGIPRIRERQALRDAELRRARTWVDGFDGPHIVLGDFNTPPESRAYRRAWRGWRNAFSEVGRGLGGTRLNGWIRVRIDHVLVDEAFVPVDARLGDDEGSDHLPMVTTVRLRPREGPLRKSARRIGHAEEGPGRDPSG